MSKVWVHIGLSSFYIDRSLGLHSQPLELLNIYTLLNSASAKILQLPSYFVATRSNPKIIKLFQTRQQAIKFIEGTS